MREHKPCNLFLSSFTDKPMGHYPEISFKNQEIKKLDNHRKQTDVVTLLPGDAW